MAVTSPDREAIDLAHAALNNDGEGRTIEDLAGDPDEQIEMFPNGSLAGDPKTTLKNLVRAGVPTTITCSISKAEVPLLGGMIGLEEQGEALVTYVAGKLEIVPKVREENGKRTVESVKLRQNLRAVHARPAGQMYTREAVLDLLDQAGVSTEKVTEVMPPAE